jgi:hypothetical protein
MATYFNVYSFRKDIIEFDLYNLLGPFDGHIKVWMHAPSLRWCWAKFADFGNLISYIPNATSAPKLPTEEERAYANGAYKQREEPYREALYTQLKGTCWRDGRFIYPEDQKLADEEQARFESYQPESFWKRNYADRRCDSPWYMEFGAAKVRTGCPISDQTGEDAIHSEDPRGAEAERLLLERP